MVLDPIVSVAALRRRSGVVFAGEQRLERVCRAVPSACAVARLCGNCHFDLDIGRGSSRQWLRTHRPLA
jgi:hypothetical protein